MSRHQTDSDVFLAIADPTRRAILDQLLHGEKPVMELAAQFQVTLSAISQHVRVLREAGLVEVRKAGRERYYRLIPEPLQEVTDWVAQHEAFWQQKLQALALHLEEEAQEEEAEKEI